MNLPMIRRVFLVLVVLLLSACQKEEVKPEDDPSGSEERTLVVYLPGRDLHKYYNQNIEDIKACVRDGLPRNSRILVFRQPTNIQAVELIEVYRNESTREAVEKVWKTYEDFDASDPDDVCQLFTDVEAIAPSRHYGLAIGCHGKAWVPAANGILNSRTVRDTGWTPLPEALATRSFGDPFSELDIDQLAQAIAGLSFRFEYLIFDACFMANIETLYDLRSAVDYVVASPSEIMGAGFPYRRVLPQLFGNGDTKSMLEKVCREYWNFYQNDWNTIPNNAQSGCITLTVTSELDALAGVMRRIDETGKQSYSRPLQTYEGMSTHLFYDLGDYVSAVCPDMALLGEFAAARDRAFPAAGRLHTAKFYSGYNNRMNPITCYSGVSVSEPSSKYRQENIRTAWYRDSHKR